MPAGSAYTPIATLTSSSNASTMTLSSIPSTYTDLVLVAELRTNNDGANIVMNFNSDTSTLYSATWIGGNGSTVTSGRESGASRFLLTAVTGASNSTNPATLVCNIMNYSNTNANKTSVWRWNVPSATYPGVQANAGLYRSTSAINSVTLTIPGNYFFDGSTITLYGVTTA